MSQTATTLAHKTTTMATGAGFHQAVPAPVARPDDAVDVTAFRRHRSPMSFGAGGRDNVYRYRAR